MIFLFKGRYAFLQAVYLLIASRINLPKTFRSLEEGTESCNILSVLGSIEIGGDPIFLGSNLKLPPKLLILISDSLQLLLHFPDLLAAATAPLILVKQGMVIPLKAVVLLPEVLQLALVVNGHFVYLILQVIDLNLEVVVLVPQLEVVGLVGVEERVVVEIDVLAGMDLGGVDLW